MAIRIMRELVLKKLAHVFPDPLIAEQALKSLDSYGKNELNYTKEGVHLAILKLCEGRLWRLRELVREAKHDFRDVLTLAQAPEQIRVMRELFPHHGGLTSNQKAVLKKKLSPAKEAAIMKRDLAQWMAWLGSVESSPPRRSAE